MRINEYLHRGKRTPNSVVPNWPVPWRRRRRAFPGLQTRSPRVAPGSFGKRAERRKSLVGPEITRLAVAAATRQERRNIRRELAYLLPREDRKRLKLKRKKVHQTALRGRNIFNTRAGPSVDYVLPAYQF